MFIALIVAPLVIRRLNLDIEFTTMDLRQPLDSNNNDTAPTLTGSHLPHGYHAGSPIPGSDETTVVGGGATATATS